MTSPSILQAKVKAIADLVWSKLTNGFTKDLHHAQVCLPTPGDGLSCCVPCDAAGSHLCAAPRLNSWHAPSKQCSVYSPQLTCPGGVQHLSCFLPYCSLPVPKGKRQLDCAGVVTTVLALCQTLAGRPEHAELGNCRFQVRCCAMHQLDACWHKQQYPGAAVTRQAAAIARTACASVAYRTGGCTLEAAARPWSGTYNTLPVCRPYRLRSRRCGDSHGYSAHTSSLRQCAVVWSTGVRGPLLDSAEP